MMSIEASRQIQNWNVGCFHGLMSSHVPFVSFCPMLWDGLLSRISSKTPFDSRSSEHLHLANICLGYLYLCPAMWGLLRVIHTRSQSVPSVPDLHTEIVTWHCIKICEVRSFLEAVRNSSQVRGWLSIQKVLMHIAHACFIWPDVYINSTRGRNVKAVSCLIQHNQWFRDFTRYKFVHLLILQIHSIQVFHIQQNRHHSQSLESHNHNFNTPAFQLV